MKKYIFALLMIIFMSCPVWADVMPDPYQASKFDVVECYSRTKIICNIVLPYFFLVFTSFWILFPLHRREKKQLLAISLIFPIMSYLLYLISNSLYEKLSSNANCYCKKVYIPEVVRALRGDILRCLNECAISSYCIVLGIVIFLDVTFIHFVFKKKWKYLFVQLPLYLLLFVLFLYTSMYTSLYIDRSLQSLADNFNKEKNGKGEVYECLRKKESDYWDEFWYDKLSL